MGHPATLYGLELAPCDVLVLGVKLDGRPLGGLTGHVDWRTGGRLSELVRLGTVPKEGPLMLPAPSVVAASRILLWAQADVSVDKLSICLKNLRATRPGVCPADLGLDPVAVRAALGPHAVLFSSTGESAEGG